MIEIILMVILMIGMNLTFKNKYAMLSTTIIFNNLLNFIFVFTLYLSYFNNKISGTTFISQVQTPV
ncbi:hypothetical protein OCI51_25715 (plasmid) [Lysinibacillus capsici]|uniref:hypothetical protein n=1 Tax=Lysinibacillus capsici TaxID=2115968 RepID=UPI0021D9E26E|nr:hypothetical protein [Lysinibacillus capsici]UYB49963.1 hypothetical protein OCI51_25715 [Lysinibacillus capsici]